MQLTFTIKMLVIHDPLLLHCLPLLFFTVGPPYTFRFRVKFYSSEPNNLHEELTRWDSILKSASIVYRISSTHIIEMNDSLFEIQAPGLSLNFFWWFDNRNDEKNHIVIGMHAKELLILYNHPIVKLRYWLRCKKYETCLLFSNFKAIWLIIWDSSNSYSDFYIEKF